jgi:hypothetical protein
MSYLNRSNGYLPTGQVNSEPVEEAPELYRVAAARSAVGVAPEEVEAIQVRLEEAGVFPVTRQDNGTLMVENEGHQPAPEPTEQEQEEALALHAERVDTAGLDSQRGLVTGPIDPVESRHSSQYADHRRALVAEKDLRQERAARRAAEEELESARRLIGQGPFAIVKLNSLNALTDHGMAEIKIGFGGGVTKHMLAAVLSLGQQAVAEEAGRTVTGEQGDTVRLPEMVDRPRCDGHCSGQFKDPDCSWHGRSAGQPQGRKLIGPPHAHYDAECTDACYEPAEEPQERPGGHYQARTSGSVVW